MKFYTSYFYQTRFFPSNFIPVSTAKFDPKWFHANKGQDYVFLDKRNVVNGLRVPPFAPGIQTDGLCYGPKECDIEDPHNCRFLNAYRKQLFALDFNNVMQRFSNLAEKVQQAFNIEGEPVFVLLVHEAPNNPCSERNVIQQWFQNNGINCSEWERNFEMEAKING